MNFHKYLLPILILAGFSGCSFFENADPSKEKAEERQEQPIQEDAAKFEESAEGSVKSEERQDQSIQEDATKSEESSMESKPPNGNSKESPGKISGSYYQSRDYSNLYGMEGFDRELLDMHFTLYHGYVKTINSLMSRLSELEKEGRGRSLDFDAISRRLGWEYDGMVLHEYYFENLGGSGKLDDEFLIYHEIVKEFGSFQKWKEDFVNTAMLRGPGWSILYRGPRDGQLINVWITEHDTGHLAGGQPLLVLDMWEHSYLTQYKLNKGEYIDAFFRNINWNSVNQRLIDVSQQEKTAEDE